MIIYAAYARTQFVASYGIAVVGHFQSDSGRADFEMPMPLGETTEQFADIMAVLLGLHCVKARFRTSDVLLRIEGKTQQFLDRDASGQYLKEAVPGAERLRALYEKFSSVKIEPVASDDLYFTKAKALALKAASSFKRTPGISDVCAFPD